MDPHPSVDRIRSALAADSFTSGTCQVPPEYCDLYYRKKESIAALNLAKASVEEFQQLVAACDAAPFGRGNETVMDENYRKALKLELSQFAIPFNLAGTGILTKIQQDLVESGTALRRTVRAELYKLNIYDQGAFFKSHQDTPRSENMFGSLVIVFPTAHEGGNLILREKEQKWSFDAGKMLVNSTPQAPSVAYVAFFSDVFHEVLPVTSGARVTLTYNLYFEETADLLASARAIDLKYAAVREALQELIKDKKHPKGGRLYFGLAHQYIIKRDGGKQDGYTFAELARYLKGTDALIFNICKDLKLEVALKLIYSLERYYDDDEDVLYLADKPVTDRNWEVEDYEQLIGGCEKVQTADAFWVTPRSKQNQVETRFIAYGNQAALGYLYGDVCLVVDLPRE